MLSADYFGVIKFPNHYPNSIGPYHLLSNASLASLNIFSINPNLHLILETKMLLMVICFSNFLFFVSNKIKSKNKIFFVTLIIYFIFYSEVKYNYTIGSNYLFFIFSIFLVQIIFDENLNYNEKIYLIVLVFIFLIHSKLTIGYIFFPILFFVCFKNITHR